MMLDWLILRISFGCTKGRPENLRIWILSNPMGCVDVALMSMEI